MNPKSYPRSAELNTSLSTAVAFFSLLRHVVLSLSHKDTDLMVGSSPPASSLCRVSLLHVHTSSNFPLKWVENTAVITGQVPGQTPRSSCVILYAVKPQLIGRLRQEMVLGSNYSMK